MSPCQITEGCSSGLLQKQSSVRLRQHGIQRKACVLLRLECLSRMYPIDLAIWSLVPTPRKREYGNVL